MEHAFWQEKLVEFFESKGFNAEKEVYTEGHHVDVVARNALESIAMELETGKSDVVANVDKCLSSGFDKVYSVALPSFSIDKLEAKLEQFKNNPKFEVKSIKEFPIFRD